MAEDTLANQDDCLNADEIIKAFKALSAEDKIKLAKIDAIRVNGTEFGHGELIQETLYRALLGHRKCPRGVPFMAFLVKTMQSLAFHAREERKRSCPLVQDTNTLHNINTDLDKAPPNPEEHLLTKQAEEQVQTIYEIFNDDEEAQLVLLGWSEGHRGRDLRELTGLDQGALDYAAKRIRIKMKKLYPNGWTA